MSWKDLLKADGETVTLPWLGGKVLHSDARTFRLKQRPPEFGWYTFEVDGTTATRPTVSEPVPELLSKTLIGYLVGDRLVPDGSRIDPDPAKVLHNSERVFLVPEELDRFSRVRAGRVYPEGPLVFIEQAFPLGPEDAVMSAYLDQQADVHAIPGVTPGLDAAFRMESFQRAQAEAKRQELLRLRAEEEARREQEARRQELLERLGDGAGRRAMARENFEEAARAALAVGGAEYLDHRRGRAGEWVVKYRVDGQRLECVCDTNLHIIDAGVCLTDHDTGEKGDTYLTLESIASVIRQAIRERKLVVWRHV